MSDDCKDPCATSAKPQIGAETLARLVSAMGQEAMVDLFKHNFYRGWRFIKGRVKPRLLRLGI